MAERHYDLCECGQRKKRTSANCRRCSDHKRFRPAVRQTGDWWSDGERFGVLCISGYSDNALSFDRNQRLGSRHGFSFWVVDLHDMAREVKRYRAQAETLEEPYARLARDRAISHAQRLNAIEAAEVAA